VTLGPTSTRGFTPGRTFGFTLALWLLPEEATTGRPLSRLIKERGWLPGKGSSSFGYAPRRMDPRRTDELEEEHRRGSEARARREAKT
jgi:hypothetical protein